MNILQRGKAFLGSRNFGRKLGQATNFVRKIGNYSRLGSEIIREVQDNYGVNHPNLEQGRKLLETIGNLGD